MGVTIEFEALTILVRPSPETNDHEVRLLADGEDMVDRFWDDMIGMDPDDILAVPSPLLPSTSGHRATVARCDCGVVGCGSVDLTITSQGRKVLWVDGDRTLRFGLEQYEAEVRRAQSDTNWETPDRTAARIVRERVDRSALSRRGLTFQWASARVQQGRFTTALRRESGPLQQLVHVPWTHETPEEVAEAMLAELLRDPHAWQS